VARKRAFWFRTREHKNLDRLLELIKALNIRKVYTDSNYAYYERFSSEVLEVTKKRHKKETPGVADMGRKVGEERETLFENRTDA
jgi:IS1 family transposase